MLRRAWVRGMKRCSCCKEYKPETEFHRNKTRGDGLRAICKECAAQKQRDYLKRNREKHNAKARAWSKDNPEKIRKQNLRNYANTRAKLLEVKIAFLEAHPCEICGESRIPCLDFHHVNPEEKERNISQIRTLAIFKRESVKCIVLCANCHRILHSKER